MCASLGLIIETDFQTFDATLASLAGLGTAADRFAYTTALDTRAEATDLGGRINVDMLRAMHVLERLSGEKLVHIEED